MEKSLNRWTIILRIGILCSSVAMATSTFAADDSLNEIPNAVVAPRLLTGTIEGVVRSTTEPLAGATVSLMKTTGRDSRGGSIAELQYQTVTGFDGGFKITGIQPESYTAIVQYPGLRPTTYNAVFSSEQTHLRQDVTLTPR